MRNFGIELEVSGGTPDIIDSLGLSGMHAYHCDCSRCTPDRQSPDWTCQEDCTSDGEFISRILHYGTAEATDAIDALGAALVRGRATQEAGNYDQVQGLHVHVDADGIAGNHVAMVHLWRLWFAHEDELADIAAMRWDDVRSYNPRPNFDEVVGVQYNDHHNTRRAKVRHFWTKPANEVVRLSYAYGRAWLNTTTGHGTFEFRLWNATRVGWRIHLAAGISVAIMQAAADGVNAQPDDGVGLYERLAPYFTPETNAAYLRHLYGRDMLR